MGVARLARMAAATGGVLAGLLAVSSSGVIRTDLTGLSLYLAVAVVLLTPPVRPIHLPHLGRLFVHRTR
jgi:hypothetical protein